MFLTEWFLLLNSLFLLLRFETHLKDVNIVLLPKTVLVFDENDGFYCYTLSWLIKSKLMKYIIYVGCGTYLH